MGTLFFNRVVPVAAYAMLMLCFLPACDNTDDPSPGADRGGVVDGAGPDQAAGDKGAPDMAAKDKGTPDMAAKDKGAPDMAAKDMGTPDQAAVDMGSDGPVSKTFCEWVRGWGGSKGDSVAAVASDAAGNIYITGAHWGPFTMGGTKVTPASGTTVGSYVAKLDSTGKVLWARSVNATSFGVAVDGSGNSFVTGYFLGPSPVAFGSSSITAQGSDVFVAKLDASGKFLWAVAGGGAGSVGTETGHAIAADSSGDVVISGNFSSNSAKFGPTTLTKSTKWDDAFAAKVSSAGKFLWATRLGGSGIDHARGVALDSSKNALVTGRFASSDGTFGASKGYYDVFVAKLSASNGSIIWKTGAGGKGQDHAHDIAVDASGNGYVTGVSKKGTFGGTTLGSTGAFVAKISPTGTFLWAAGGGGLGGNAVITSAKGDPLIAGRWGSPAVFGSAKLTAPNKYTTQIFLASAAGATKLFNWAKAPAGYVGSDAFGLARLPGAKAVVVGSYNQTAPGGLKSNGANDLYLCKFALP